MNTRSRTLALMAATAFTLSLAALPDAAEARERTTTVTGAKGKTATRNVTRAGGDVQSSSTGPKGNTRSRSVDRSAQGTTATVTKANGETVTRTTTVTQP